MSNMIYHYVCSNDSHIRILYTTIRQSSYYLYSRMNLCTCIERWNTTIYLCSSIYYIYSICISITFGGHHLFSSWPRPEWWKPYRWARGEGCRFDVMCRKSKKMETCATRVLYVDDMEMFDIFGYHISSFYHFEASNFGVARPRKN